MAEPAMTAGQAVAYTKANGDARTAIAVRVRSNGLLDLLVLPDASHDMGVMPYTVQAVAYDAGGGHGTWAGVGSFNDVETVLAAGITLQKRTVTVGYATLTDAVSGEAQAVNVGAALPANAIVLGHEVILTTQFTGGSVSACKLDLGVSGDSTALVNQFDVKGSTASGKKYSPGYAHTTNHASHATGLYDAAQLIATFTPTADSLSHLTAGALTITVWFSILA